MNAAAPEPATELDDLREAFARCWDGDDDPTDGTWREVQADRAMSVVEPELARLHAEIAALRAGEDDTPVSEGAFPTPEQMLYRVNRLTRAERQQWIHHVAEAQEWEHRCFVMDHFGKIENLKVRLDHALNLARDLSARPTQHAYEAACEALERRRVALVSALQQPADMAFDDAVAVAGHLAGGAE